MGVTSQQRQVVRQERRQVLDRFSAGRLTAGELVEALRCVEPEKSPEATGWLSRTSEWSSRRWATAGFFRLAGYR